jgi:hypothetical protein
MFDPSKASRMGLDSTVVNRLMAAGHTDSHAVMDFHVRNRTVIGQHVGGAIHQKHAGRTFNATVRGGRNHTRTSGGQDQKNNQRIFQPLKNMIGRPEKTRPVRADRLSCPLFSHIMIGTPDKLTEPVELLFHSCTSAKTSHFNRKLMGILRALVILKQPVEEASR